MEALLRRNVIERDWYGGIDTFYAQYGREPERAYMNYSTYNALTKYIARHRDWICGLRIEEDYEMTSNDWLSLYRHASIWFKGVKIYIHAWFEDEVVGFE